MNVSLSPQLEKYVNGLVKTGDYQSSSEVVREGLRLVQERRKALAELHRKVDEGLKAIERGEYHPVQEVMAEWKRRDAVRARKASQRRRSA